MHMMPELNLLIVLSCSDIRIKLYLALHFYTVPLDGAIENKSRSYCSYLGYIQFVYCNDDPVVSAHSSVFQLQRMRCPRDLANELYDNVPIVAQIYNNHEEKCSYSQQDNCVRYEGY